MKKYCHLCGALYIDGKTQPWVCGDCGNLSYLSSLPTVEMALFNKAGEVLLAKRAIEPNKGKFDLPGGFINYGETVEAALKREVVEELSLAEDAYTKPVYCLSWGGKYVFSKETHSTLNMVFAAKLKVTSITAKDDVSGIAFVAMDDLNQIDFSYDGYPKNIRKAHKLLFGE